METTKRGRPIGTKKATSRNKIIKIRLSAAEFEKLAVLAAGGNKSAFIRRKTFGK